MMKHDSKKWALLEEMGIPRPERRCDGGWNVPTWNPKAGWELVNEFADERRRWVSRSACGDPSCDGPHTDDPRA